MKKSFILFLTAILAVGAMAQTRKVAILETVDREKALSYGIKLMIRGQLAEAVTNTPGYEAYDRTNLQQIFDEQEFQRTGFVSDEDIKKIGEMTGVQYVLVAEAGKIDEKTIVIDAKILNVETARVVKSANVMTQLDVSSLQKGAQDLTSRLLANVKSEGNKAASSIAYEEGYYIKRVGMNEYKYGDQWMTKKDYYNFINDRKCIPAYHEFQTGHKLATAGWSLLGIGGGLLIVGGILEGISSSWQTPEGAAGFSLMMISVGLVGVSIPLLATGYWKKDNAYKKFNENCAPKKTASVTLNLQSSRNGIGLALCF